MNSFLDYLIENSDCLYIYNRNFSIYGLPDKERYTIVVKNEWVCPEDWIGFDTNVYEIYKLKDWFNIILNGELIGWECACINKKYIIKEHVKLLMTTNPLQLRKAIDKQLMTYEFSSAFDFYKNWELVKNIKFSTQIIENHKIVNFKEALIDYNTMLEFTSNKEFYDYIHLKYDSIKNMTDGMVRQEILSKIKKYE